MSLGTGELASETGDDSLSAITFDSDFETKAKRKSYHKPPPTSPKSPYCSKPRNVASWRSLRTMGSMPVSNRMSLTPQKLWLGTSKQGSVTQALTPELTWEQAWNSAPSGTSEYLTEALRIRRSSLRRSASHGRVPGTPAYRDKEDMYDEIIELKKSLHTQKSDVDLLRTKLRRVEEENSRKDRQIEQLLDSTRGPDFMRTLAEKRPDAGWVVNGLKQRILKLEQQCKDKDSTINKLQTDMKTTNLEEMRIAMETYYEEIHRLQTLLATSEAAGKKVPVERKLGLKRQKKMSNILLNLSRSVQELTEENQTLKEDLDRLLSNSPSSSKIQGTPGPLLGLGRETGTQASLHGASNSAGRPQSAPKRAVETRCPRSTTPGRLSMPAAPASYNEWSKPRLLRRITELEKKVSLLESLKSHASELAKPSSEPQSSSTSTVHRQPRTDPHEGPERLRGALRSLQGEHAIMHSHLQEKDLEVKQLLQTKADLEKELAHMKEGEKEQREREETLRWQVQTLTKKLQELEEAQKAEQEQDAPMKTMHETLEDPQTPLPTSSCPQQDLEPDPSALHSRPPSVSSAGREDEQREAAARVLQAHWRACSHKNKVAALHETATVLQAAFRGHLARAQLLASRASGSPSPGLPSSPWKHPPTPHSQSLAAPDSPELEKAVMMIQAIFRAHLARTRPGAPTWRAAMEASNKRTSASSSSKDTSSPASLAASPVQDDSEASSGETGEESMPEEDPAVVEPTLSGPSVDEVHSDDSDDVIISPSLPGKKSTPSSALTACEDSLFR